MSKYFNKIVSQSATFRPLTVTHTANAVVRAFSKRKPSKSEDKIKGDSKDIRQENRGPLRKLKFEQNKCLSSAKKLNKTIKKKMSNLACISNKPKTAQNVLDDNKTKLYDSLNSMVQNNSINGSNTKIKKCTSDSKSYFARKHQRDPKFNRFNYNNRQKLPSVKASSYMPPNRFYPNKPTSVIEPPRNQHMKQSKFQSDINATSLPDRLLPVSQRLRNSIAIPNDFENDKKNVDPLLVWKHPTLANKIDLDLNETMKRILMDSQKFQIGRQSLVEKHSPWERHPTFLSHLDNADYSAKCAKRYNAVLISNKMEKTIKPNDLLEIPNKDNSSGYNRYGELNQKYSIKKPTDTVKSSVASLRTSVNKKIYSNYPNLHRSKTSAARTSHASSLRSNQY